MVESPHESFYRQNHGRQENGRMLKPYVWSIEGNTEHMLELRERVWQWCRRNLYWLLKDEQELVATLRHGIDEVEHCALAEAPRNMLNGVPDDVDHLGDTADLQTAMVLSALSLRPSIDALLARYGIISADGPTLANALQDRGLTSGLSAALASKLREGSIAPLQVAPNDPGDPLLAPQVVVMFRVDDLPLTPVFERFCPLDDRARKCTAWIHLGAQNQPDVFEAIPETDMDAAAIRTVFDMLNALCLSFCVEPFEFLSPEGRFPRSLSIHTSASPKEISDFFEQNGVRVWSGKDALRYAEHWYRSELEVEDLDDPRWSTPELWDNSFPPRSTPKERRNLVELVTSPKQSFWERVQVSGGEPLDRFACVHDALAAAGMADEAIYASLVPWIRGSDSGPWVMHLATAIADRKEVPKALRDAGFTEWYLQYLGCLLKEFFLHRTVKPFPAQMPCAPIPVEPGVPEPTQEALRKSFPVVNDRYLLGLHRAFIEDGGLFGDLSYLALDWSDGKVRPDAFGTEGREPLMDPEELQSPEAVEILQARLETLRDHPDIGSARVIPFHGCSVAPEILDTLTELLPIRSDKLALNICGNPRESEQGVHATFQMSQFDDDGSLTGRMEQEVLVLTGPHPLQRLAALRERLQGVTSADPDEYYFPHEIIGDPLDPPDNRVTIACDVPEPWDTELATQADRHLNHLHEELEWEDARLHEAGLLAEHGAPAACWWIKRTISIAGALVIPLEEAPADCPWRFHGSLEDTINKIWAPVVDIIPSVVELLVLNTRYLIAMREGTSYSLVYLFDQDPGVGALVGSSATMDPVPTPRIRETDWTIPWPLAQLYRVHDGLRTHPRAGGINPSSCLADLGADIDAENRPHFAWHDLLPYRPDGAGNAQCFNRNREDGQDDMTVSWDHGTREISTYTTDFWHDVSQWLEQLIDDR
jgi:hypothetical protein